VADVAAQRHRRVGTVTLAFAEFAQALAFAGREQVEQLKRARHAVDFAALDRGGARRLESRRVGIAAGPGRYRRVFGAGLVRDHVEFRVVHWRILMRKRVRCLLAIARANPVAAVVLPCETRQVGGQRVALSIGPASSSITRHA